MAKVQQAVRRQAADLSRREDLAGTTQQQGNDRVTYDADGYAVSAVKERRNAEEREGTASQAAVPSAAQAGSARQGALYDPNVDYHARAVQLAAAGDWQGVDAALASRQAKIDAQGGNDRGNSNASILASLRREYGETAPTAERTIPRTDQTLPQAVRADTAALRERLDQWRDAAGQQAQGQIDRAVRQGVNELAQAERDAAEQFQTQQNQIDIDEARAKDNQALYAEVRGDRGGIGAAQYDSIMNTAARNRQAVNSARTRLASDTAREMAQLRAQGEFEKADALLGVTQQYLAQLMSLEQWGMQYDLSVDQFNAQLAQWLAAYRMQLRQLDISQSQWQQQWEFGQRQYANSQAEKERQIRAGAAQTILGAGVMPSESQLAALGLTRQQARDYLTAVRLGGTAKSSGKREEQEAEETGLDSAEMNGLLAKMSVILSEENWESAGTLVDQLLDAYWEKMTEPEQKQVYALLRRYNAI